MKFWWANLEGPYYFVRIQLWKLSDGGSVETVRQVCTLLDMVLWKLSERVETVRQERGAHRYKSAINI